jgi:hypothetical protein
MRNILFIALCGLVFAGSNARLRAQELDSSVHSFDPSVNVRIEERAPESVRSDFPAKKPTTSASWAPARNAGLWHASDHSLDSPSPSATARPSLDPPERVKPEQPLKLASDRAKEKRTKFGQPNISLSEPGENEVNRVGNSTTEDAAAASGPKHETHKTFPSFNRNAVGAEDISLFPEAKALHAGSTATPSRRRTANTPKSDIGRRQSASDPRQDAK